MYIYIGGDSFCAVRDDDKNHWPAILAKLTNLTLEGKGFAGLSWWTTRKHLINYIQSDKFNDTEYFIFVHTDFDRALSDSEILFPSTIIETYRKYFHSYDISTWIREQWFSELNQLLKSKKVIHLHGFNESIPSMEKLDGVNLTPCLLELSMNELGSSLYGDRSKFIKDNRSNHLSPENNQKLASFINNVLNESSREIKILL